MLACAGLEAACAVGNQVLRVRQAVVLAAAAATHMQSSTTRIPIRHHTSTHKAKVPAGDRYAAANSGTGAGIDGGRGEQAGGS